MNAISLEAWLNARPPSRPISHGRFTLGAVVGEWRVEAFLGKGLSAEVYRVVNTRTGREGALKLLVEGAQNVIRERFLAEMDAIRFLQSRDLPSFYGSGVCGGSPYYVMEYLQPLLLPLQRGEVPRFIVALAKAVQRLHTAGYVHRDIKPANILRRRNGEPVLIDLGLVKKMEDVDAGARPSALSLVNGRPVGVGTIGYAAPEQLIKGEATARSDVFSLGKVLMACFEGRPPGVWLGIVRRATQESPDDRYPTADDFARAVRRRNLPRILTAAGAVVLAGMLAAALLIRPAPSRPAPPPPEPPTDVSGSESSRVTPESLRTLPDETDEEHLNRLLPIAEKGNMDAQLMVAEAFFYGRGTVTNREEAVSWYKRAAESGSHEAEDSLGLCALRGWGCPKNFSVAVDWFFRAAEARNLSAINNLAFCYMNGFGVEKDEVEAFNLARDAAEHGHAPAQVLLAECYMEGRGTRKNLNSAELWLQAAARQGNKRAKMLLDCL